MIVESAEHGSARRSGMVEGRQEFTRMFNTPGLRDFPFFWIREKVPTLFLWS